MRIVLGLLLLAAADQPPETIVSYDLQLFTAGQNPAVDMPVAVKSIPLSAVTCGLPRQGAPSEATFVPRVVRWDDPANIALQCETVQPAFLQSRTGFGLHIAVVAVGGTRVSARSAWSNALNVPAVSPAKPTGVIVVPH